MEPGSALLAQPYPTLGRGAGPYEEERPGSDLSSYATLKAVGKKDIYITPSERCIHCCG